ncbi:MAG: hypothetical protein KGO96_01110 [Elusimicrobia bacterium]|nr:hypothetical protein [Elusimicrobiota bacterium]
MLLLDSALLLLAAALGAFAQEPGQLGSAPLTPVSSALSSSMTIRGVRVERLNVFDLSVPGEDWWLFRLADDIHVKSREAVVRRELLQEPGQRFSRLKALESERNLRELGIFRSADVGAVPRPDGGVDLLARTQDSWTLKLLAGAGTEGGERYFSYGASEGNLLGYGKSLSLQHSQSGEIIRDDFFYTDPRLLGSRFRLSPHFARTNHGDAVETELVEPFFSLDTPRALDAYWNRSIDELIIHRDGADFSKFLLADRTLSAGYGLRQSGGDWLTRRWELGWYSRKDDFVAEDATAAGSLPPAQRLSGPTLGYFWVQPRYIKETYINKMERVEDFNLGNELSLYGGFMGEALGSDRDAVLINALDQQGLFLAPGRFVLAQAGLSGRLENGRWRNALFFANLNLFWKVRYPLPQTWVAHLEANTTKSLDGDGQIVLGGNNGLRGYENYSFTGARSVLLNLEDRLFLPGEYFHLLRFGAAAFLDSGSVLDSGVGFSPRRFDSDVGLGLRFSSTRSQSGDVVRADLAYALNRGPGPGRWVVSIRARQAFQIFNSSAQNVRAEPASRL